MTSPKRSLLMAGTALVSVFVIWSVLPAPSEPSTPASVASTQPTPERSGASAVEGAQEVASAAAGTPEESVSYAIAVPELHGLGPQVAPGTELEVWVAWEPPVTKGPEIHRLLDSVILEEVTPPLLPDGPHVAMLVVPRKGLSDLLYGDRYGALSVVVPQRSGTGR